MQTDPIHGYPIPAAGSQDYKALAAMFRGMAIAPTMRSNDLGRDEASRAKAEGVASSYHFCALMLDSIRCPVGSDEPLILNDPNRPF